MGPTALFLIITYYSELLAVLLLDLLTLPLRSLVGSALFSFLNDVLP